ncbi:MAG: amidase [Aestuariivita sp.]|nr:amidase [Aestuariivita sp.]
MSSYREAHKEDTGLTLGPVNRLGRSIEDYNLFFKKIAHSNKSLNAFSEIFEASAIEEVRRSFEGPSRDLLLSGMLIATKDNIDTVPAVCTAGLSIHKNYRPDQDATVVSAIRKAGAIIVGVTRTHAGAYGVTTPLVQNPLFPDRITGGSSGGSAAAVAAELCDVAIGTDTGGSIRIPAACCGVYGFKPTSGVVSLNGVRPLTKSYDHVGPIARSITNLSFLMYVLAPQLKSASIKDKQKICVGIPRKQIDEASSTILTALDHFASLLETKGVATKIIDFPSIDNIVDLHLTLSLKEAADIYKYLTISELATLPAIAQNSIEIGLSVSKDDYERAAYSKVEITKNINCLFQDVNYLLLPTLPIEPPLREEQDSESRDVSVNTLNSLIRFTSPFNQTGHPVLAFPWAAVQCSHPPVSLQLVGPQYCDHMLLEHAQQFLNESI